MKCLQNRNPFSTVVLSIALIVSACEQALPEILSAEQIVGRFRGVATHLKSADDIKLEGCVLTIQSSGEGEIPAGVFGSTEVMATYQKHEERVNLAMYDFSDINIIVQKDIHYGIFKKRGINENMLREARIFLNSIPPNGYSNFETTEIIHSNGTASKRTIQHGNEVWSQIDDATLGKMLVSGSISLKIRYLKIDGAGKPGIGSHKDSRKFFTTAQSAMNNQDISNIASSIIFLGTKSNAENVLTGTVSIRHEFVVPAADKDALVSLSNSLDAYTRRVCP